MKVCITGKPSSGKTTATLYLKSINENIFIVDDYVNQIYKKGEIGYKLIEKTFGKAFVNDHSVNKKKLGSLVFNDNEELKKLNNLINPLIIKKINELNNKQLFYIELGTYIYYHQHFSNLFDKIILIYSQQNIQKIDILNKFSYLKKLPTFFVGNHIKVKKYKYIKKNNQHLNIDFYVENNKDKKSLNKKMYKINKRLKKMINLKCK